MSPTFSAAPNREDSPSDYQQDCARYYHLLRATHTGVYAAADRREQELSGSRYRNANHSVVRNLGSLIGILHRLCGDGEAVQGIDYGCGSHWFVDHVRKSYGWSAVGYDPDELAIGLAQQLFPESRTAYRNRNVLRDGLPESDASQQFVFCNAVVQHFDDGETHRALAEVSRVLQPGGVVALIFKRWVPEFAGTEHELGAALRVLDASTGMVLFLDPTMKEELQKLDADALRQLSEEQRQGWRRLHLFRVDDLVGWARQVGLEVIERVPVSDDAADSAPGVLTYTSGKGMTTACAFFRRRAGSPCDQSSI